MLQIFIQKSISNIYHFSLHIFNYHSCHHNSECDMIHHWGIVVCEIHTWNLAETFCHKSGTVHAIPFHLRYPSAPNQSTVIWTVISSHMSPQTHVQHLLELQANGLSPFDLDIRSVSNQASWKLCGSSGSDIVLVTKAISCSHSFKVLSSLISANALSGLDPSACIVLAATGSLAVVWLLVLDATSSSQSTPTGVSVGSSACD